MKRKIVALVALLAFCSFGVSANAAGLRDIFNAKYYADQYKDLYDAFGYDEEALYDHYLTYGINEGRSMNPIIDVVKYREGYEDLDTAFGDNWDAYVDHYFTYGIKEKRDNGTDFDIAAYVEAYDDIEEAFGNDFVAIAEHYQTFGINENRQESSKVYQEVKRQEEIREQEELRRQEEENATPAPTPMPDVSDDETEGRVETEYFDNGSYWIIEYNSLGELIKRTAYDEDRILVYVSEYENGRNVKNTMYNPDGSVNNYDETVYGQNGEKTVTIYNFSDVPKSVLEYDRNGKLLRITNYDTDDSIIGWTEYTYDAAGNQIKSIGYDADGSISFHYEYEYDSDGNKIKSIDYYSDGSRYVDLFLATGEISGTITYHSDGSWDECVYDTEHAELEEESLILLQHTRYDASGTMYHKMVYEYHYGDTVGSVYRIKETIYNATGARYEYTYAEGDICTGYASYDAQGNLTGQNYYSNGKVWKAVNYGSDGIIQENEYDHNGKNVKYVRKTIDGTMLNQTITERTDEGVEVKSTQYNYNEAGECVSTYVCACDDLGNYISAILYDANGSVQRKDKYEYNVNGKISRISYYDANDELTHWTEYSYDENGTATLTTYDKNGNII